MLTISSFYIYYYVCFNNFILTRYRAVRRSPPPSPRPAPLLPSPALSLWLPMLNPTILLTSAMQREEQGGGSRLPLLLGNGRRRCPVLPSVVVVVVIIVSLSRQQASCVEIEGKTPNHLRDFE